MNKLFRLIPISVLLGAGLLLGAQSVAARGFAVDLDGNGIALKGHDPVAYFAGGKPARGQATYSASVDGATYRFVSAENRSRFISDPERYTPAYGGFCALGVSRNKKVNGDPSAWEIVGDRLYINSSPKSLAIWSEDIPGNIEKADAVWPVIKDKDPALL